MVSAAGPTPIQIPALAGLVSKLLFIACFSFKLLTNFSEAMNILQLFATNADNNVNFSPHFFSVVQVAVVNREDKECCGCASVAYDDLSSSDKEYCEGDLQMHFLEEEPPGDIDNNVNAKEIEPENPDEDPDDPIDPLNADVDEPDDNDSSSDEEGDGTLLEITSVGNRMMYLLPVIQHS